MSSARITFGRKCMRKRLAVLLAVTVVLVVSVMLRAQDKKSASFAAVPGAPGGQDMFGAYDVVPNWPKPLSALPGNEKWTWGAGQSVFAESPNRVFILERGELPNIERPKTIKLAQLGPSIEFPIGRLPWRDATSRALREGSKGPMEKSATIPTSARTE